MKAVIYARYSSHAQKDTSIEQQVMECDVLAKSMGLDVIQIYADKAKTGKTSNRSEFQRMIKDSKTKFFSYVITYKNDRFARNRMDSAIYKKELAHNDVKVIYAAENIPDTPEGIILESVLEGLSEYYSVNLSQNVTRGMRDNARRKKSNGSLPLGYQKDGNGFIVKDERNAEVVRNLFEWVAGGLSVSDYVRHLEANDIRKNNGEKYAQSNFYHALKNERYTGTYMYDDIIIRGAYPEIVSKALYNKVATVLKKRKSKGANNAYVLTGKAYCGICGSPLVGVSGTSGTKKIYYYYRCINNQRCGIICASEYMPQIEIEEVVRSKILFDCSKPDFIKNLLSTRKLSFELEQALKEKESEFEKIENSISNLLDAIETGCYSNKIKLRLEKLEENERQIHKAIFDIKVQVPNAIDGCAEKNIRKLLSTAGKEKKDYIKLLNRIVSKVEISNSKAKIEYTLIW